MVMKIWLHFLSENLSTLPGTELSGYDSFHINLECNFICCCSTVLFFYDIQGGEVDALFVFFQILNLPHQ